ncbi:MAG TPA: glycosyltransferase family 2 protein [Tepidisphaeraceae bacterium]|nr:glycosyltransferase family 2 protein [Tepidisphaeraceae bacterium]
MICSTNQPHRDLRLDETPEGGLHPPSLSVIIPAYNEIATIGELVTRVMAAPYPKQIIIVDDGSTDGTAAALAHWRDTPGLVILTHPTNLGKGHAIRTGLSHAHGVFTLVQDADLEYDPGDYARLLEPLLAGEADMVLGSRYLNGGHRGVGWFFRLGVHGLNWAVRVLYGIKLTDEATCYKVTRTAILRRMDLRCSRFEFCPEVIAKACRMGLRIVEVPVSYSPRGKSDGKKIRLRDGVAALRALWRWRQWEGPAGEGTPSEEIAVRRPRHVALPKTQFAVR